MSSTIEARSTRAPGAGALLRSEILRARSRRSLRWMSLLAVLAVLGVCALMWFSTGRVTQTELDAAASSFLAEQQMYYEQCIADPTLTAEQVDEFCYQPTAQEAAQNALWNLDRRPFDQDGFDGLLHFAGGIGALVCLLLAATTGGADWGARTMGLVLSWEPRRTRVFLVRLLVVVVLALLVEGLLLVIALGLGSLIADAHALDPAALSQLQLAEGPTPADLGDATELALRWLPLAALAAAGSFAVAMLTRSTGWAIGASIGFVAVVESVVQGVWAWGSQWLVQTNIAAWLSGGITWVVDRNAAQQGYGLVGPGGGENTVPPGSILISDTRGLATLAALVVVAGLLSWITFRRRDVE